jgi:hypothetical protein
MAVELALPERFPLGRSSAGATVGMHGPPRASRSVVAALILATSSLELGQH